MKTLFVRMLLVVVAMGVGGSQLGCSPDEGADPSSTVGPPPDLPAAPGVIRVDVSSPDLTSLPSAASDSLGVARSARFSGIDPHCR